MMRTSERCVRGVQSMTTVSKLKALFAVQPALYTIATATRLIKRSQTARTAMIIDIMTKTKRKAPTYDEDLDGFKFTKTRKTKHDDATRILLPTSDTPIIRRNKEMRRSIVNGDRRRSSSGMRGRRASSLIDEGRSNGQCIVYATGVVLTRHSSTTFRRTFIRTLQNHFTRSDRAETDAIVVRMVRRSCQTQETCTTCE